MANHQCYECGKVFSNTSSLRRHAQNFHKDIANVIAPKLYKNATNYNFNCQCGKNFSDKANFTSHLKTHSSFSTNTNRNTQTNNKNCPLCAELFSSKNEILKHFKDIHEIAIKSSTIKYNSENEFYVWKNKLEADTNTSFVKENNKYSQKCLTNYFVCNRSGNYVPKHLKQGERKRYLKSQGSCKMNAYCPASLKFKVNKLNNTCNAEFIETHVGHDADPGYINLSKSDRQKIAHKISSKIPFDEILNEVRENVTESEVSRIHLLRRKDLYNIEQCVNLSSAVRDPNDGVSVESWVKEMEEEKHCVLFYKPQGTTIEDEPYLKDEDFVLIIMTTAQRDFLAKYGSDVICIDGTHGMNSYHFELTTLLVLDDLREGFPCSFLISNRADKEIFKLFFSKIKEEVGIITPKVFMSDMAESFYNAWIEIMGVSKKRLFCTWHVLRAWKKNLVKIKSKDKQNEVSKQLRCILKETDVKALERMLLNFQSHSIDPDITDFISYFEENYLKTIEHWAYAYRLHAGINTNMHLERFHEGLKYIYLKGKNVKQLDKGICAIMRFVRDRLFDGLISRHKGKICSKVKEIRARHKNRSSLDENVLIECEHGSEIPSKTTQEMHLIQKTESNCRKYQLKCTVCNICIHEDIFSCVDPSIKFNTCKHIHLVANSSKAVNGGPSAGTGMDILHIDINEEAEEKNYILNEVHSKKAVKRSLEEEKVDIQNKIARHLKDINSPTKLQIIKNILAPLSPTLAAVDSSNNSFPSTSSCSTSVPHNKIVSQRLLFSAKKKNYRKKAQNFSRPTPVVEEIH